MNRRFGDLNLRENILSLSNPLAPQGGLPSPQGARLHLVQASLSPPHKETGGVLPPCAPLRFKS